MVVVLVVLLTRPPAGDTLQLYVAPGLLVTLRLISVPAQVGLGMASRPAGADGALGSVSSIGPLYTPEVQPPALVMDILVYVPAAWLFKVATPLPFDVTLAVSCALFLV